MYFSTNKKLKRFKEEIAKELNIPFEEVDKIWQSYIDTVKSKIKEKVKINMVGFGTFAPNIRMIKILETKRKLREAKLNGDNTEQTETNKGGLEEPGI